LGEGEERGLKGVLGCVSVAEDSSADSEYHRPVPLDKRSESGLVLGSGEPSQEVGIGTDFGLVGELLKEGCDLAMQSWHRTSSAATTGSDRQDVVPGGAGTARIFREQLHSAVK
jgi:hypothetical protein